MMSHVVQCVVIGSHSVKQAAATKMMSQAQLQMLNKSAVKVVNGCSDDHRLYHRLAH